MKIDRFTVRCTEGAVNKLQPKLEKFGATGDSTVQAMREIASAVTKLEAATSLIKLTIFTLDRGAPIVEIQVSVSTNHMPRIKRVPEATRRKNLTLLVQDLPELSVALKGLLAHRNVVTIKDILSSAKNNFDNLIHVGPGRVREMRLALANYGIRLPICAMEKK